MRWAVLVALAGCGFSIGGIPDGNVTTSDGSTSDGPLPASGRVRRLDVLDAQIAGGPHTDFPLLVDISGMWLRDSNNGGDVASVDGFDVYFAADSSGTTRLAHEVESYAPLTGGLVAWVKVPSLTAASVLYIHYGDPAIMTSQENAAAVWSDGYELVAHLDAVADSTGNTASLSATSLADVTGQVGRAREFNGTSDMIAAGSAVALDNVFALGGTAEGWFYATGYGESGFGRLFDKGHTNGWSMALNNGNATNTLAFVYGASGSFGEWNGPSNAVALNGWHHAAITYTAGSSADEPTMYIDGIALLGINELVAPSGTPSSDASIDLIMGNRQAVDRTFDGQLDELRLSSVVRSADWLLTQYRSQRDPGAFLTVSAELSTF